MRNFTLLLLCFFTAISGINAQTLNESAFPVAGDAFRMTLCNSTGFDPGSSGTNITWNFASLTSIGKTQVDSFMDPASTPYAAIIQGATIAQYETTDTNWQYIFLKDNPSVGAFERIANIHPDTVIYSVLPKQFPYPFSYSNTYSGSYYASYNSSGGRASETGTASGSADGTGTLITPAGTFSNVLRTHYLRNETDTIDNGGFVATSSYDYYTWYQPNSYFPIMEYLSSSINYAGHTITRIALGYRMGYATQAVSNISNDNTGWMVFPNPTNTLATILFVPDNTSATTIALYDISGREVMEQKVETTSGAMQTWQLNTSSLQAGIYTVTIVNNNGRATRKLEILH